MQRNLEHIRPTTPDQLHDFIEQALGFTMPRRALAEGNRSPFDYLVHTYFEELPGPRDCVVWANRGGGKTQLGAIATLLDLVFKPGIQIRILAGSFEQASKMHRYLAELLRRELFAPLVEGSITGRAAQLRSGSRVEVLAQSERAVRGQRIHKLRCDEVELLDEDIWSAAQMTTRSGWCGDVFVRGCIEALSTMHRPFGLMQRLLDEPASEELRAPFRWDVIDVLERCPPERSCESCPLWQDCRGRAKEGRGFVRIDDAIAQMRRISADTWKSEMLCRRPSMRDLVYPEFDEQLHVCDRAAPPNDERHCWLAGLDFGYRSPTVLLWAVHDREHDELFVVDEHVASERTAHDHIALAEARDWPHPRWAGADPAGHARDEHTGDSTIALWRAAGWRVKTKRLTIEAGVEAVRARLRAGDGAARLRVHPRCKTLIRSMQQYHFDPDHIERREPVKDGNDHACDALRYLIINLDCRAGRVKARAY